jgi:hypothetical protein
MFGLPDPNRNGNPSFHISQIATLAVQYCMQSERILTLARLYPDEKQIPYTETASFKSSKTSVRRELAPISDTEDPRGGLVPLYERKQYAMWFSQHPQIKKLLIAVAKAHTPFVRSFEAMCQDTCMENQRDFKQRRVRFARLSQELFALINPNLAIQASGGFQIAGPASTPPTASDNGGDGLVTIAEIAFLSMKAPKTLRNTKVLGEPEVPGARSVPARWRYSRIRPLIEARFREVKMPEWSEAKVLLKR